MQAGELVAKSYYLSEIVSRELETVSGSQSADGLEMLNDLLDEKSVDGKRVPFFEDKSFPGVSGQEIYFIPGLIEPTTLTFVDSTVRYAMQFEDRDRYHGRTRVQNITTFPQVYTYNRVLGGSNVYVYFKPNRPYQFEIWGKYFIENVVFNTEMSDVLPKFYMPYLKYALADRICDFFNIQFSEGKTATLREKEREIFEPEPADLSINLIATMTDDGGLNYAAINFYRGLWPS